MGQRLHRWVAFAWYGIGVLMLMSAVVKGSLAAYEAKTGPLQLFAGFKYFFFGWCGWWLTIAFAKAFLGVEVEEFLTFLRGLFVPKPTRRLP